MICFISVKEIKALWKKLRDGHRQALNKKKPSNGQAGFSDSSRVWKYEKQMAFLVPYLSNRQRSTNVFAGLDMTQQSDDNTQVEVEDEESVVTAKVPQPQVIYRTNIPRHKRKSDHLLLDHLELKQKRRDTKPKTREVFRQELLCSKPEDTGLKKFFDSMCDQTSALPEYLNIKVQRQVFNIVMEAREKELKDRQRRSRHSVSNSQYTHLNFNSTKNPLESVSAAFSQEDSSTSNEEYSSKSRN